MTVIFLLGHFSRKLTRRNIRPPVVRQRARRMRAIKGIDRRVTRKLGVVPLESSLINSFELREQLEEIQLFDS